jgi:hypothetical protein
LRSTSQRTPQRSLSRPSRLAFVHECLDAEAKVVAAVARAHEIIAL